MWRPRPSGTDAGRSHMGENHSVRRATPAERVPPRPWRGSQPLQQSQVRTDRDAAKYGQRAPEPERCGALTVDLGLSKQLGGAGQYQTGRGSQRSLRAMDGQSAGRRDRAAGQAAKLNEAAQRAAQARRGRNESDK
eukprot:7602745-Alexandrium_andersonii.AAC.1